MIRQPVICLRCRSPMRLALIEPPLNPRLDVLVATFDCIACEANRSVYLQVPARQVAVQNFACIG